MFLIHSFEL